LKLVAKYLPATRQLAVDFDLWAAEGTLGEANADDVSLIGELHDVSSRFGATPYVHELLGSDET
jgi:hypothetical protein